MTALFVDAMRRATEMTRTGDPLAATRLIQSALSGAPSQAPEPPERATPERARPDPANASAHFPRRSLGGVVRALREGRARVTTLPTGRAGLEPDLPDGAQFLARAHRCASGARDYRLYVPASASAAPRGLIVMLHGCKQNPEDFAVGTAMNAQAEAAGFLVAYPAQTGGHNPTRCWNWFRPGDQRAGSGEPEIIASLARALVDEFDLPPGRVFVAGLSAGGAMAAVLGAAYPDLFAALGVHSGLPAGTAWDVPSAFAAMRGQGTPPPPADTPPTIVFHGAADAVVDPVNAGRILAPHSTDRVERGPGLTRTVGPSGEVWHIDGLGHAWSGGDPRGSYTQASGPDASAEMIRFFQEHAPQ